MTRFEDFLTQIQNLKNERQDFVIITLVDIVGSAPQEKGAKCIVTSQGLHWGSVGGGKVENHSIKTAKDILHSQDTTPHFYEWNLQKDIGMSCGGLVKIYFEKITSQARWQIAIFGAGHVAQELVPLLLKLDVQLKVYDTRSEWLNKFQQSSQLEVNLIQEWGEGVESLPDSTFVCVMTMGHGSDVPVLRKALAKNFPYLGVIGSSVKGQKIRKELTEEGFKESARIICPIGEKFGNDTPYEIALSIVAQLLKLRSFKLN